MDEKTMVFRAGVYFCRALARHLEAAAEEWTTQEEQYPLRVAAGIAGALVDLERDSAPD